MSTTTELTTALAVLAVTFPEVCFSKADLQRLISEVKMSVEESAVEIVRNEPDGSLRPDGLRDWSLRKYDGVWFLLKNVKGRGLPSGDSYYRMLEKAKERGKSEMWLNDAIFDYFGDYHRSINAYFEERYYCQVYVCGRSGGWWGFRFDDLELTCDIPEERVQAAVAEAIDLVVEEMKTRQGRYGKHDVEEIVFGEACYSLEGNCYHLDFVRLSDGSLSMVMEFDEMMEEGIRKSEGGDLERYIMNLLDYE